MDSEDIFLWCDGVWCYRYELYEMNHKSDDYEVLPFESARYLKFIENEH